MILSWKLEYAFDFNSFSFSSCLVFVIFCKTFNNLKHMRLVNHAFSRIFSELYYLPFCFFCAKVIIIIKKKTLESRPFLLSQRFSFNQHSLSRILAWPVKAEFTEASTSYQQRQRRYGGRHSWLLTCYLDFLYYSYEFHLCRAKLSSLLVELQLRSPA